MKSPFSFMPWKSSAMARSTTVASLLRVACRNCFCRSMSYWSKAETGLGVWAKARVAVRTVAHSRDVGRIVRLLRHDFTSCCNLRLSFATNLAAGWQFLGLPSHMGEDPLPHNSPEIGVPTAAQKIIFIHGTVIRKCGYTWGLLNQIVQ